MAPRYPAGLVDALTGERPQDQAGKDWLRDSADTFTITGGALQAEATTATATANAQSATVQINQRVNAVTAQATASAPSATVQAGEVRPVAVTAQATANAQAVTINVGPVNVVPITAQAIASAQNPTVQPGPVSMGASTATATASAQSITAEIAPRLANLDPASGERYVELDTLVSLQILDDIGMDLTTVRIYAEGNLAYRGDTDSFIAPYNGAASARTVVADGWQFVIDKDGLYSYDKPTPIHVVVTDVDGNTLDTTYYFTSVYTWGGYGTLYGGTYTGQGYGGYGIELWTNQEFAGPYLANRDPYPDESNVSIYSTIWLDVLDVFGGVDDSTVVIYVDGTIVWQNGAAVAPYTGTVEMVNNGFRYHLTPDVPFGPGPYILIRVTAADYNANTLDETYSFEITIDVEPPYLDNIIPPDGSIKIPSSQVVSFDILDVGTGVNQTSIVVYVNGVMAYNGGTDTFHAPFNTAGSAITAITNGYHLVFERDPNYPRLTPVTFRVVASDNAS